MLSNDERNIAFGLINLGFRIYDSTEKAIYVNDDSIPDGYIFGIDDSFTLQRGDLISRDGHIHVYLGDGKTIEADNFGWGKVSPSFPQKNAISVEECSDGSRKVKLITADGKPDYYTRVYRYMGK